MLRTIIALVVASLALAPGFWGQARADEAETSFFDGIMQLWSGSSENQLQFSVELRLESGPSELKDTLEDVSALVTQSEDGVPSAETLLALAREEPARLIAALYQEGYYSGQIAVAIAGNPVSGDTIEIAAVGIQPIPVTVTVDPGPSFRFGEIRLVTDGEQQLPGMAAIADDAGLVSGRAARSGAILDTGRNIITSLKDQGYAFARVAAQDVTADHAGHTVSVVMTIAPGRQASFGEVEIRGSEEFNTELLRSRAAIPAGEDYSPAKLQAAQKRLTKLEGIAGARIVEGDQPDENGRIPIIIDVTERKRHYFGANAAVSSVDGAELNAYWGHRNVFGGGEALLIEGTLSNLGGDALTDLEYETKFSLAWPSIHSAYTDYKTSISVKHEEPDSFESDEASASAGVIHRFTPDLTGDIALKASWIETEDALGAHEFFLISLPAELVHDTRDNTLDPSEGWRATLFAEPVTDLQNSTSYVRTRGQISTYAQISGTPRIVAAARLGAGTIAGAGLDDVPAPDRFLSGGGGSVRGYAYQSVGPLIGGERIGGLSVVEVSGELRIRVTETIGIVPFVDAAFVTSDSFFAGESETVAGAGLGLRYHSAIGPIRLDVATPLDRMGDDPEVVVYVGLGQAF